MSTGFYSLDLSAATSRVFASFSVKLSVAYSKLLDCFFRLPLFSQILEPRPAEELQQHSAKGLWQALPGSGPKLTPSQWPGIGCSLTQYTGPNASLYSRSVGQNFCSQMLGGLSMLGRKVSFFPSFHHLFLLLYRFSNHNLLFQLSSIILGSSIF